jgi:hypothetical protein
MMNRDLKPTQIEEPSTCPKCGKKFHCSPSGKCWCIEVFVAPDMLSEINEKYDTCLCPECLKGFSG